MENPLRKFMQKHGFTQHQLSDLIEDTLGYHISQQTISTWVTDRMKPNKASRFILEFWSDGEIPREAWDEYWIAGGGPSDAEQV